MSGTSADGVDVGLITTHSDVEACDLGPWDFYPYPADIRYRVGDARRHKWGVLPEDDPTLACLRDDITDFHIQAIKSFVSDHQGHPKFVPPDIIGFHGQTIWHIPPSNPATLSPQPQNVAHRGTSRGGGRGRTCQLANGPSMARALGLPVVTHFRDNDMAHGGQGAPLVPLFHWMLLHNHPQFAQRLSAQPTNNCAVWLNIGGVSNITLVTPALDQMLARDVGPGNALMDDWVQGVTALEDHPLQMDEGGKLASAGTVKIPLLTAWMDAFTRDQTVGPCSLDRDAFSACVADCQAACLSLEDGAATLTAFTAACIAHTLIHTMATLQPLSISSLIVSGGGVHNQTLMKQLQERLGAFLPKIIPAQNLGWPSDAMEAYAFAYLAIRSLKGLPLTYPGTTGVDAPVSGGVIHFPSPSATRAI